MVAVAVGAASGKGAVGVAQLGERGGSCRRRRSVRSRRAGGRGRRRRRVGGVGAGGGQPGAAGGGCSGSPVGEQHAGVGTMGVHPREGQVECRDGGVDGLDNAGTSSPWSSVSWARTSGSQKTPRTGAS